MGLSKPLPVLLFFFWTHFMARPGIVNGEDRGQELALQHQRHARTIFLSQSRPATGAGENRFFLNSLSNLFGPRPAPPSNNNATVSLTFTTIPALLSALFAGRG